MPKTTNLGIEITTSDDTLFSDWRDAINGDNPESFANIVDAAIGNVQVTIGEVETAIGNVQATIGDVETAIDLILGV